jgi:hypothetical protein
VACPWLLLLLLVANVILKFVELAVDKSSANRTDPEYLVKYRFRCDWGTLSVHCSHCNMSKEMRIAFIIV